MRTYSKGLRILAWVFVTCTAVMVLVVNDANSQVDFVPSPGQITADALPCTPTVEGTLPGSVIVLPEGETEPILSTALVGPALEQVFNNGPYIGVVMDFCQ
jgi:hypothetical protein